MPRNGGLKRAARAARGKKAIAKRKTVTPPSAATGFEYARMFRSAGELAIDDGPRRLRRNLTVPVPGLQPQPSGASSPSATAVTAFQQTPQPLLAASTMTTAAAALEPGLAAVALGDDARDGNTTIALRQLQTAAAAKAVALKLDKAVQTYEKRRRKRKSFEESTPLLKRKWRCEARHLLQARDLCPDRLFTERQESCHDKSMTVDDVVALDLAGDFTDQQLKCLRRYLGAVFSGVTTVKERRSELFRSTQDRFGIQWDQQEATLTTNPVEIMKLVVTRYGLLRGEELRLKLVVDGSTVGRDNVVWFLFQVCIHTHVSSFTLAS